MSGMQIFVTIVHVLLCVFMIFVILLQPGKDAGMGAAFGGGAATSAFGGRGAVTFLSKVTAVCAGLFFVTSLGLSMVGMSGSVADKAMQQSAPATPAPEAPQAIQNAPADQGAAPAAVETGTPGGPGATTVQGTPTTPHTTPPAVPAQELKETGVAQPPAGGNAPAPAPGQ